MQSEEDVLQRLKPRWYGVEYGMAEAEPFQRRRHAGFF
jgi:hypothetical protein